MFPRVRIPELMDSPDIPDQEHRLALRGLESINRISHAAEALLPLILSLAQPKLSLLDVACGGGEVPVTLACMAKEKGIDIELTVFDRSETAVASAREKAKSAGIPCRAVRGDLLRDDLPPADVVSNSLFLHHLDRGDAVRALSRLKRTARRMVIVNDLRRSRLGLALAWTTTRIMGMSRVVRHDASASVHASWRISELRQMADDAGMHGANIDPSWPWRMLLVYRKDET